MLQTTHIRFKTSANHSSARVNTVDDRLKLAKRSAISIYVNSNAENKSIIRCQVKEILETKLNRFLSCCLQISISWVKHIVIITFRYHQQFKHEALNNVFEITILIYLLSVSLKTSDDHYVKRLATQEVKVMILKILFETVENVYESLYFLLKYSKSDQWNVTLCTFLLFVFVIA